MPIKKERIQRSRQTFVFTLTLVLVLGLVFYTIGAIAHQLSAEKNQMRAIGAAVQTAQPEEISPSEPEASVSAPSTVQMQDFPNDQQGVFVGQLNADYFKEPIDQIVVLFISARIPGLSIMYYPYEKRLVAGTPQMVAENIALFEGSPHEIKYAFQKDGNQQLWYDGDLVAETKFQLYGQSGITGAVTGVSEAFVSEGFENVDIR